MSAGTKTAHSRNAELRAEITAGKGGAYRDLCQTPLATIRNCERWASEHGVAWMRVGHAVLVRVADVDGLSITQSEIARRGPMIGALTAGVDAIGLVDPKASSR